MRIVKQRVVDEAHGMTEEINSIRKRPECNNYNLLHSSRYGETINYTVPYAIEMSINCER